MKRIESLFQKYISNTATQAEKQELNEWIASNIQLRQWLETKLEESSETMDEARQNELLEEIHQVLSLQSKKRISAPQWIKYVAAVAIALLISSVGFNLIQNFSKNSIYYSVVEASKGQKTNITLPDGSKVTLNSETRLTYDTDFNLEKRVVSLCGEAYFEVAKNERLPFIVNANKFEIEAVGTSFNVRAYENEKTVSTTLVEGKVNVKTPISTIQLLPDERIELSKGDFSSNIINLSNSKFTIGWLNDFLSFENATLADVAADLSRMYNVEIKFDSESIMRQRFTGKISNNSLDSVLRIISLTSPIKYNIVDNTVHLYEIEAEKELFKN